MRHTDSGCRRRSRATTGSSGARGLRTRICARSLMARGSSQRSSRWRSHATRRVVAAHAARFERRQRDGRAVDGHGDLHLQHVGRAGRRGSIAIDCLEFSESLRWIDAAADVAFLAMDLRYRGANPLAERFLRTYARESDDFDLYAVVDYFIAYRAGVRAKVAALAARDDAIPADQRERAVQSAVRHVALAAEALAAFASLRWSSSVGSSERARAASPWCC